MYERIFNKKLFWDFSKILKHQRSSITRKMCLTKLSFLGVKWHKNTMPDINFVGEKVGINKRNRGGNHMDVIEYIYNWVATVKKNTRIVRIRPALKILHF